MMTVNGAEMHGAGKIEVSQAAKQIWRFGSQLSRGVWGSPAIFDVIPTTLPHSMSPVASMLINALARRASDRALTRRRCREGSYHWWRRDWRRRYWLIDRIVSGRQGHDLPVRTGKFRPLIGTLPRPPPPPHRSSERCLAPPPPHRLRYGLVCQQCRERNFCVSRAG